MARDIVAVRPQVDELEVEEARFEVERGDGARGGRTDRWHGLARGERGGRGPWRAAVRPRRPGSSARRGAPARGTLELARPADRGVARVGRAVPWRVRRGRERRGITRCRGRGRRAGPRRGRRAHRDPAVAAGRRRRCRGPGCGSGRCPPARTRRRSGPGRCRTARRHRRCARHAARPGRDRRRVGAGRRGRVGRIAHRGRRGRSDGRSPRPRRAARLGHERRGDRTRRTTVRAAEPGARRGRPAARQVVEIRRCRTARRLARCRRLCRATSPPPSTSPSTIPTPWSSRGMATGSASAGGASVPAVPVRRRPRSTRRSPPPRPPARRAGDLDARR